MGQHFFSARKKLKSPAIKKPAIKKPAVKKLAIKKLAVKKPAPFVKSVAPCLRVVLVEPEIPPNTGSIARLCAANNCELILLGKLGFELSDARLKRAGLDYWRFVHWQHYPDNPQEFLQTLPVDSVHLFSRHAQLPYTHCPINRGDWLVFGSESTGLSPQIVELFDKQCYTIIQQNAGVRSLNLATAVGIVVYEGLRRF